MIYGLYLSTAGAKAESWRHDIIANNVANSNTTGFRQQFALVRQRLAHEIEHGGAAPTLPGDPQHIGGGLHMFESPNDLQTQGTMKYTGRNLDLAVQGEGFFEVRGDQGEFLTRNGSFAVDAQGNVTTADGSAQLLASGGPLKVDPNVPLEISNDGQVFQNGVGLGRIGISVPQDEYTLQPRGNSLFSYVGALRPAGGSIAQNYLEGSNVEPIEQMVDLIDASRAFQININMIQLQDQGLSTLLQTVPRVA